MNYFNYYRDLFVADKTTKALFQAVVVLAGCFLLGAKEQGAFMYKQEAAAYELKFKVEAANNGLELQKIDCSKAAKAADCHLAKYKIKSIESYTEAFISVMDLIGLLFEIICLLCVLSFALRPLVNTPTVAENIELQEDS